MERRIEFMKQRLSELWRGPNWFQLTLIQNMNEELISACFLMVFFLSGLQYGAWKLAHKGLTYLKKVGWAVVSEMKSILFP